MKVGGRWERTGGVGEDDGESGAGFVFCLLVWVRAVRLLLDSWFGAVVFYGAKLLAE